MPRLELNPLSLTLAQVEPATKEYTLMDTVDEPAEIKVPEKVRENAQPKRV